MPRRLNLPDTASVAAQGDGGRLFAPSAARNAAAIVALVVDKAPSDAGRALELASGTGQHIVELARACPHLQWQPTEVDAHRRASIDAYLDAADLPNIRRAANLDATAKGWSADHRGQNFILLVNLLHLISKGGARVLIAEAARALAAGGVLMIYGPFMRDDVLTSDGDAQFDASLRAQDPEIGYKGDFEVVEWGQAEGLEFGDMIEMPANNLGLIWHKPA